MCPKLHLFIFIHNKFNSVYPYFWITLYYIMLIIISINKTTE